MDSLEKGTILFNKYKIINLIGKGNMGNVYLVEKLGRQEEKQLVIKELKSGSFGTPDWETSKEIFKKEASFMAGFDHPGLPKLFEAFSQDGREYLVMEYILGLTLEEVIKNAEKPMEWGKVIDWIIQLCNIMDYLHNSFHSPIVYRDLKPSNIIVTTNGQIKLVDFGIARYYNPDKNTDTVSFGTPGYAAPEQYKGRGQSSPQSDIFGLGVIMFQLLTLYDPTVKLFSFPPMKSLNPEIPGELEKIVRKAIEMKPLDRHISMTEFRDKLKQFVEIYNPQSPPPPPGPVRFSPPPFRRQSRAMDAICSLLAIIGYMLPLICIGACIYVGEHSYMDNLLPIPLTLIGVWGSFTLVAIVKGYKIPINIKNLIVVWLVLGCCSAISMPGFFSARRYGQLAGCESNLKDIAISLEMYATDYEGNYPPALDLLTSERYMREIPFCPRSGKPYVYEYNNRTSIKINQGNIESLRSKLSPEKTEAMEALLNRNISEKQLSDYLTRMNFTKEEFELVFSADNIVSNYTLYCSKIKTHINVTSVYPEGNYPQYTSAKGLYLGK